MSKFRPTSKCGHKEAKAFAKAYRCGYCHSMARAQGTRIQVAHDDSCPVLGGTVPDAGDSLRAVGASGQKATVIYVGGKSLIMFT